MHKKCEEILNKLECEGKIKISNYKFPQKQELKLKLKDMLDAKVDEKYYLKKTSNLVFTETRAKWDNSGKGYGSQQDRAYYQDGLCPTLSNCNANGDKSQVVLADKTICLNSKGGRNGVEGLQPSLKDRVYDSNGIATCCATSNFFMPNYTDGLRIRKLTEKECLKLMGFDDEDYEKIKSIGISRSQIYKQAGNSIVVNVLEAIFKELFKEHIAHLDKWSDLD